MQPVLDRLRRRAWGLSGRLTASYVLVTVAVVVLVEALVLGYQAPRLVNEARLQGEVGATLKTYVGWALHTYPDRTVPIGTLIGQRGQPARPGQVQVGPDGTTLVVPAITGRLAAHGAVTAVVVLTAGGTVLASSDPSRYPPGRPVGGAIVPEAAALLGNKASGRGEAGSGSTPAGEVSWAISEVPTTGTTPKGAVPAAYVYVQAPESNGFANPIRAWDGLRQLSGTAPLLSASYVLLIAIVPVGVVFGLLASRRLVGRVRRLERAAVAVAEGDYTVALPTSGRDEVGRLEANFTTMTRQLGSALTAERERATADARAGERARIAREIHDAISQHLFGLRMIAAGMRKADPGNEQARAVERIAEEALRDMQALLLELRPPSLDGAGLAPALEEICSAYRERLGVTVDAHLDDVTVPTQVGHALLRIAQEAFTNAVRHGEARHLTVSMGRRDGQVVLCVRDSGRGFDPLAVHTGSGLSHIRDRVGELAGTLDIDSAPGQGAAVTVRVPVP